MIYFNFIYHYFEFSFENLAFLNIGSTNQSLVFIMSSNVTYPPIFGDLKDDLYTKYHFLILTFSLHFHITESTTEGFLHHLYFH